MSKPTQMVKSVSAVQAKSFSGPIPAPEDLEHYDRICPGFADRILKMAEAQAANRQVLERKNADIAAQDVADARKETKRGQWMSFMITLCAFASCVVCAALGQPWVASVIAGATLVSIVSTFLNRKK